MLLFILGDLLSDDTYLGLIVVTSRVPIRFRKVDCLTAKGRPLFAHSVDRYSDLLDGLAGCGFGVKLCLQVLQIQSKIQDGNIVGTQFYGPCLILRWCRVCYQQSCSTSQEYRTGDSQTCKPRSS